MAILNNNLTLTTLQDLVNRALTGAMAGQFFDLDDLPNLRRLTGEETAQKPGGVRGLGGDDTLIGSARRSDTVNGNAGNDYLDGGNTLALLDVLRGGQGNDTLLGSGILHGNRDNDLVLIQGGLARGGQGDDTLIAFGSAVLIGDFGTDLLVGGPAETVFVLRTDSETGTALATADVLAAFQPQFGHRIAVVGDFPVTELTFETVDAIGVVNQQRRPGADGTLDTVIRRGPTVLGIVNGFSNVDVLRSRTEVVPFSDPALQLG